MEDARTLFIYKPLRFVSDDDSFVAGARNNLIHAVVD